MIGQVLSRYRVARRISVSAIGDLFEAEEIGSGRRLALEVLRLQGASDPERMRRFAEEAAEVRDLHHPGIAAVETVEEAEGVPFVTLPPIEGRPLSEVIPLRGVPRDRFFSVALPLVGILAAAHRHGLSHRILEPGNVLLTPAGQVKVLDFGLAALRDGVAVPEEGRRDEAEVRHLPYLAPEQVRGEAGGPRSDVFTLGVILYRMVAGHLPFQGKTTDELLAAILEAEPRPILHPPPDLHPHLRGVLWRSLAKDPEDRYPDAGALEAELLELQRAIPETPPPMGGREEPPVGAVVKRPRRRVSATLLLWLAGLVLVAVLLGWWWRSGPAPAVRSLAVVPWEDVGPGVAEEPVGPGLASEVRERLGGVAGLRVAATGSTLHYVSAAASLPDLAAGLRVDAVLEGTVLRGGDELRVVLRLVDGVQGRGRWTTTLARPPSELSGLPAALVEALLTELGLQPPEGHEEGPGPSGPVDGASYLLYLRARALLEAREPPGLRAAGRLLEQVEGRAPAFAPAPAALAEVHARLATLALEDPVVATSQATGAAARAVALDPRLALPHRVLGWVRCYFQGDPGGAEDELAAALRLGSRDPDTELLYGLCQEILRHREAATAPLERALGLDSQSALTRAGVGWGHYLGRRLERARAVLEEARELDPGRWQVHYHLGQVELASGHFERSLESLRAAVSLTDSPLPRGALGVALAAAGDDEGARKLLAELVAGSPEHWVPPTLRAAVHGALGDLDDAFADLEAAIATGDPGVQLLGIDPLWEVLRSDPRFPELLQRVRR